MKKHAWLILCLITFVAAFLLSLTNMVTEGPIAQQKLQQANAARAAVFAEATGFDEMTPDEGSKLDSLYAATKDGQTIGYVLQTTVNGYGGPIEIVMGVGNDGAIRGISVGGSSFAETAGLGTRTRDPEFTDQFIGLAAVPKLKDNIDGISGATISSTAVTSGAARLYAYWQTLAGVAAPKTEEAPLTAENQKTVMANGYGGEFDVTVGINPDGTIEGVRIGQQTFNETDGLGALALEQTFRDQFIGKTGPVSYGDGIDAISGATITSNAVLQAINEALGVAQAQAPAGQMTALDTPDANGAVKVYTEGVAVLDYTLKVTVGLDAQGQVVSVGVSGPTTGENEYFVSQVKANAFRKQFIGKSGTLVFGEGIDAVSGATKSSTAVLEAVNNALQYQGASTAGAVADAAQATAAPAEEGPQVELLDTPNADGAVKVVTEILPVLDYKLKVVVGLDAEGKIASLTVGSATAGTSDYYVSQVKANAFRNQFIGKSGTLAFGEGIDAVSGATLCSDAVLQAVNDALTR